jgi:hypothetical protein
VKPEKKKRVTKADMSAKKEAEVKAKADKAGAHLQAITKVASIKDAQQAIEAETDASPNHPPVKKIAQVARTISLALDGESRRIVNYKLLLTRFDLTSRSLHSDRCHKGNLYRQPGGCGY